jgi:hypothetical protein
VTCKPGQSFFLGTDPVMATEIIAGLVIVIKDVEQPS